MEVSQLPPNYKETSTKLDCLANMEHEYFQCMSALTNSKDIVLLIYLRPRSRYKQRIPEFSNQCLQFAQPDYISALCTISVDVESQIMLVTNNNVNNTLHGHITAEILEDES